MSDLSPILFVLLLIVGMVAYVLFQRIGRLEKQLRAEKQKLDDKASDAEKARSQNRERATELEQLRKQLQDTKTKLKRVQKDQNTGKKGGKTGAPEDDAPSTAPSAASTVRVTNQALQDEHNRTVSALKSALADTKAKLDSLQAAEAKRKAQAQEAVKALEAAADAQPSGNGDAGPSAAATPEDRLAALETQLEAYKRAAGQQEKKLKKELKKEQARANAAHRRANSSHSLYLVIKAQLDLTSDRLALLKRKYEGAMPPEALRPDKPTADEGELDEAAAAVAEAEAEAAQVEAQARAEEAAAGVESPAPAHEEDEVAPAAEETEAPSPAVEEAEEPSPAAEDAEEPAPAAAEDEEPALAAAEATEDAPETALPPAAQEPEKSRAEPQG